MHVPTAPGCALCGRPTYDPDRKEPQWARGVSGGRQVLVCPPCQAERPDWRASLDRCLRCGGTRLGVVLGEVVCRGCGHVGPTAGDEVGPAAGEEAGPAPSGMIGLRSAVPDPGA